MSNLRPIRLYPAYPIMDPSWDPELCLSANTRHRGTVTCLDTALSSKSGAIKDDLPDPVAKHCQTKPVRFKAFGFSWIFRPQNGA